MNCSSSPGPQELGGVSSVGEKKPFLRAHCLPAPPCRGHICLPLVLLANAGRDSSNPCRFTAGEVTAGTQPPGPARVGLALGCFTCRMSLKTDLLEESSGSSDQKQLAFHLLYSKPLQVSNPCSTVFSLTPCMTWPETSGRLEQWQPQREPCWVRHVL